MSKRIWFALAAALLAAGGVHAQEPQVGPVAPPSDSTEVIAPMFEMARTLADSNVRLWANADYMVTFMRGFNLPPLVTTSPPGTPSTSAGILGQSTTTILFGGGDRVTGDARPGFRLNFGVWFNPEQSLGIEAGFLMTASEAAIFSGAVTDGSAILARPFTNANFQTPQAVLVAFPGSTNGSIDIRANSNHVYGAYLDLAEKSYDDNGIRMYSLVGYRFYRYDESLRMQQNIIVTGDPLFVPGTTVFTNDNFSTRNQFHGIDLGIRSQFDITSNLSLEVVAKVAVGEMHRDIDIGGNQTSTVPGASPVTRPGGFFALSSNSGSFAESDWRAIPEVGATLGWKIRPNIALRVGYSFIYFNAIARAADQLDTTVNPQLAPGVGVPVTGPQRPAFNLIRSDMWLQSLNFGLEFTY
jgi:hypothetical protein